MLIHSLINWVGSDPSLPTQRTWLIYSLQTLLFNCLETCAFKSKYKKIGWKYMLKKLTNFLAYSFKKEFKWKVVQNEMKFYITNNFDMNWRFSILAILMVRIFSYIIHILYSYFYLNLKMTLHVICLHWPQNKTLYNFNLIGQK